MRAKEFCEDSPPLPQSPSYTSDWDDDSRTDIDYILSKIDKAGPLPVKEVPLDKVHATQNWLDWEMGGGDPVLDQYDDRPVYALDKDGYHILDGHHRTSKAFMRGEETIKAYVYEL